MATDCCLGPAFHDRSLNGRLFLWPAFHDRSLNGRLSDQATIGLADFIFKPTFVTNADGHVLDGKSVGNSGQEFG